MLDYFSDQVDVIFIHRCMHAKKNKNNVWSIKCKAMFLLVVCDCISETKRVNMMTASPVS